MRLKVGVIVLVLSGGTGVIAEPTLVSAQQTPRERADSLQRMAIALDTLDEESPRLWLLVLAAWSDEGARALLAGDRDRLRYASMQETSALWRGYKALGRVCWEVPIPPVNAQITSHLAYASGVWDGQGGVPANASQLANKLLEVADRYRGFSDLVRRFC